MYGVADKTKEEKPSNGLERKEEEVVLAELGKESNPMLADTSKSKNGSRKIRSELKAAVRHDLTTSAVSSAINLTSSQIATCSPVVRTKTGRETTPLAMKDSIPVSLMLEPLLTPVASKSCVNTNTRALVYAMSRTSTPLRKQLSSLAPSPVVVAAANLSSDDRGIEILLRQVAFQAFLNKHSVDVSSKCHVEAYKLPAEPRGYSVGLEGQSECSACIEQRRAGAG